MTFINANVLSNFVSLQCLSSLLNALLQNTMAEQNVPAQPPTRTDEQIVPRSQWLSIGKSNLLFNAQKIQKNPIFQISVDILSNTNFFQAFTASANVPAIYLKALAITPVNPARPFELPPSGDTVIDFVNELGYPEPVEIVSSIRMNYVYQPSRAILCLLNQCLTGKTSGSDKPRHPVLQILWGIVTQTNVDHAELIWEDNNNIHRRPDSAVHHTGDDYILGNLKFVPKGESVEVFGMAIPDPLITEAIQQSSYYPKYLKMVAENTKKTPKESASVQPATKRATPKKPTTTTPVKQSKPAPPPTKKPSKRKLPQKVRRGKPTFKLVDEDDEAQQETIPPEEGNDPDLELAKKLSLETPQGKGEGEGDDADLERAIKLSLDPAFLPQGRAPVGGVTIRDPVSETTSKLHEVVGKGKAVVTEEQVAHSLIDLSKKKRTTDQFMIVRRDQTPHDSTTGPSSQHDDDTSEKVIHESSSTSDSERTESETETAAPQSDKDQGEVDSSTVTSGVSIPVSVPEKDHEALAGPDPEPMKEDQTGSDSGKLHVSLAGPNPEHMDDEFLATAYPKVHENLKLITDERVIDDKPESHSGSMSSMKNLDDSFNFGDQFLHDKPTEDDQEKSKVREESDSTFPDPSHQTVTSTPPVIPPFIEISSSMSSLLVTPPPINTEATTITTSLPEITSFHTIHRHYSRLFDNISRNKLADALHNVLERHCRLIETYHMCCLAQSLSRNHESEKRPKEIIRAKRNKMRETRCNLPPSGLYHALMEALIADEDAMDKEVADKVKDHKRKHDSDDDEDDDDDEGPSAGSNQGDQQRGRRSDSAASGSAKPPLNVDGPTLMMQREFMNFKADDGNDTAMESHYNAHISKLICVSEGHQILRNIYEPLPLGGPPGQVTIQPQFFFNKDLDYLLTELVPSLWVESEREYDISAVYGITHWWFRRKEFYINKHSESSDREAVRSQMRILSVISVKVFEKYGYNYLREIILRRADYQEYKISEKDFKNLYPNDFEDLFLLNIQEKLNHLPKTNRQSSHQQSICG
ncbi:hypothetical protein Tco_1360942 [Tanacetum coccineum]